MRNLLILLPFVAVSACASPREACIRDAIHTVNWKKALINDAELTIERGHDLRTATRIVKSDSRCSISQEINGDESCIRWVEEDYDVPVPINLAAEREKLAKLRRELRELQPIADQRVAQCQALHPE